MKRASAMASATARPAEIGTFAHWRVWKTIVGHWILATLSRTSIRALGAAASACPSATSTAAARNLKNGKRRLRAVRPDRPTDITETLRAMSLMRIGIERAPEQRSGTNQ